VAILPDPAPSAADPSAEVGAWAASGAMALTGRPDGPALGPPAGLVAKLQALAARLAAGARALGGSVTVDPLALLGERAAMAGLGRRGPMSCGGATRLLRARDGWLALTLARPDDVDLLPAWLDLPGPPPDPWAATEAALTTLSAEELVRRGRWLGLPVAWLPPEVTGVPEPAAARDSPLGDAAPTGDLADAVVIELGSLWAGPLCGSLLGLAGAQVIKVESIRRPDGARSGPAAFLDLLNGGKRSVALDLATADGVRALRALVTRADVVVEASRPRALEQLGIDAAALVAAGGPRAWVSITGHGRRGPARDWVAFGDDAAVAGGLAAWDDEGPVFCADAVADPATGLVAAVAALEALAGGGRHLLDVPLVAVAAHLAGPTRPVDHPAAVAAPRARLPLAVAPRLGQHTGEVLTRLGVGRSVGT
jgi:hypothetical protein